MDFYTGSPSNGCQAVMPIPHDLYIAVSVTLAEPLENFAGLHVTYVFQRALKKGLLRFLKIYQISPATLARSTSNFQEAGQPFFLSLKALLSALFQLTAK